MNDRYHQVIGIDLGTTYSAVALFNRISEQAEIIGNQEDNQAPTTPSVVSLDPQTRRVIIGSLAKRNMALDPQNTIIEIKREMGETFREATLDKYRARGKKQARTEKEGIEGDEGDPVQVLLNDEWLFPQEISAFILMKMKEIVEKELGEGEEVRDAVITVPAYFTEKQKKATKEAALLAGLYPRQLIPEPTAAAICYGLDHYEPERKVYLVYDLGGGTFDVSIITVEEERIEVIATSGDPRLGGGDFDDEITNWALNEIRQQVKVDLSNHPAAQARLKLHAEETKILLSTYQSAKLPLVDVLDPQLAGPVSLELTREKFEELIGKYLTDSIRYVDLAIQAAEKKGVRREDVDAILLVGGSSKIPLVRSVLLDYFQKDESFVRADLNPDAVVARGAAKLALKFAPNPPPFEINRPAESSLMSREAEDELDIHLITEHTLGVAIQHNQFSPIVLQGTHIPVEVTRSDYVNAGPGEHIEVRVYQGEGQYCHENTFIGMVYLGPMEPKPAGHHQFEVTFRLDVNGLLTAIVNHLNENKTYQGRFEHKTGIGGLEALANMRKKLLDYYQKGFLPGGRPEVFQSQPAWTPPFNPPPPPPPPVGQGSGPETFIPTSVHPSGLQPPPSRAEGVPAIPRSSVDPRPAPLIEAQVEIPEQFKSLIRRAQKQLLKQHNSQLAKSFNAFITTSNEGGTAEDLEDLALDLEHDYHEARKTGA